MQANEIQANHCYATAENQQRKVVRVDHEKVWYETFRADRPGVWLPAHAEDAPSSLPDFASEVCVKSIASITRESAPAGN
jgi:hypothetical protein